MMGVWRRYNLSVVLACLWIVSWTIQTTAGWMEFTSEQAEHGRSAELADYGWVWLRTTFENNASEFLQLFTMVVLTSFLVHQGSGEGKQQQEQSDRTEQKIDALRSEMEQLTTMSAVLQQRIAIMTSVQQGGADHPFRPFYTGDGGGQLTACGVRGCELGADKHPEMEEER